MSLINYLFTNIGKIFWILLLLFILSAPNGSSFFFDGLPWIGAFETILIIIFIPVLFIFDKKIFFNSVTKIFLLLILLLKIILIFTPQNGIAHNQYLNNEDLNNNLFISSYDTFWNKNYTNIQKYQWNEKKNFPIDWINWANSNYPEFFTHVSINDINIIHKIKFFLIVDESKNFKIDTGLNAGILTYFNIKDNLSSKKFYKINNNNSWIKLEKGIYKFEGHINYSNDNFRLIPYEKHNNDISVSFNNKTIFYNIDDSYSLNIFFIFNILGSIFDILLFVYFTLTLLFFIVYQNNNYQSISLVIFSSIFFLSSLIIKIFLNKILFIINYNDHFGSWSISLTFIFLTFIFIFF